MPTVCLLSPAQVWVNPRLRKEADSLQAAGYNVVVGYRADGDVTRDDAVLATRPWHWHRVDLSRRRVPARWLAARFRQRAAQSLWRAGLRSAALGRAAYCAGDAALLRWARQQPADLYIAHTQPVLAIAAAAAAHRGVPYAFDCEDLLAQEDADGGLARWRRDLIVGLERRYLKDAAYVSVPSEPMAQYLAGSYGLRGVRVWHNCFPAAEAEGILPPDQRPRGSVIELAWLSATIGPRRGLEDAFAAVAQLAPRTVLHLYGAVAAGATGWLDQHLAPLREQRAVVLHPLVPPERVIATLAAHQIGLALDGTGDGAAAASNKSLTASNKTFYYLQAGLACVATNSPGQQSVLPPGGGYGFLYPAGDVPALAAVLEQLMVPGALAAAQRAAWDIGRRVYVWDVEQTRFLDAVGAALGEGARESVGERRA
jgi:glycosyltransferase involved in cell wall biosynthesis